jgi:cysteinyl-tRNA synthetase
MAMKYLGESFDVHGGGEDLVFPHHECEMAQSEAATGQPFARYWVYNGFINMGAEKMSKSLGNVLAIRELAKRHSRDAIRLWMLGAHYRSTIDFAEDRLREAARALDTFVRLFQDAAALGATVEAASPLPADLAAHRARFIEAMDDDFNTPQAVAVLFQLADAVGKRLAEGPPAARDAVAGAALLRELGGALGLFEQGYGTVEVPPDIQVLVGEREAARKRKDYARADALRNEVLGRGWLVEDKPGGPRVTPRRS